MQPFIRLEATACPLAIDNLDTDQLIPARFMSRPRGAGYGGFLLHDLRFAPEDGSSQQFVLDHDDYKGAQILVAGRNFGSGSSREAAVYALIDFGIRAVIAPGFGDIFAGNAVKNGLLPAKVTGEDAEWLQQRLTHDSDKHMRIDLETEKISFAGQSFAFAIDPVRRLQLLNGWDDLDLTLRHETDIADYRRRLSVERAWVWPRSP